MLRTILFTDIEGSTRLWEDSPEAMRLALARHDRTLTEVFDNHGMTWSKGTGDGLVVAFETPRNAVLAAVEAQRSLVAPGEDGLQLKIRIGVHSGEVIERDGDLFGPTMNRAARIMSAAHGGQTVVSSDSVETLTEGDAAVSDLGMHRLKDLLDPAHLFQVNPPGLSAVFPRLRSLPALTNLPIDRSSFLGRDDAVREIVELMGQRRLVTLVGPGGVGKTRLANHALAEHADRFSDGAWFLPLAAVTDPETIPAEMARILGLLPEQHASPLDALLSHLAMRNIALLVDNCEHVIDEVSVIVERLLQNGPQLTVVATSREPLSIGEEAVYRVEPLALSDAADLFVDRATQAGADFDASDPAVNRICERLDGLALAIELAAPKVRVLGLQTLEQRLDDRFSVLQKSRGGARHQRTLGETIAWSYELADQEEQLTLARLSVFSGLFSLDAATYVAGFEPIDQLQTAEALERLVDRSLVSIATTNDAERFYLLESIKAFAAGRLTASTDPDLPAERLIEVMERIVNEETEPGSEAASQWLATMHRNATNLRAALADSERLGFNSRLARFVVRAAPYWIASGSAQEGVRWAESASALHDSSDLQETLGDLYLAANRNSEADRIYDRLLVRLSEGENLQRARIIRKMASRSTMVMTSLRSRSGAARMTEALNLLGEPDDGWPDSHLREWINLQLDMAGLGYFGFDSERQRSAIESIRPWIHRANPRQTVEFEIVERGLHYQMTRYRPVPGLGVSEAEFRGIGPANQDAYGSALFRTAFYELLVDEIEAAHRHLAESSEIAERLGSDLRLGRVYAYYSLASRRLGRADECRQAAERAQQSALAVEHHSYMAVAAANLGWCAVEAGDIQGARPLLTDSANRFAERAKPYPFRWIALLPLIDVHARAGEWDQIRAAAGTMLETSQQRPHEDVEVALTRLAVAPDGDIGQVTEQVLSLSRLRRLL